MRFEKKKTPKHGERRVRSKFCWYPTLYGDTTYWLESVMVEEEFEATQGFWGWRFVNMWSFDYPNEERTQEIEQLKSQRPENLTLPTPVAVPLPPGHWHPENSPLKIPSVTVPANGPYVPFQGVHADPIWDGNGNRILPKGISPNGRMAARQYDQEMIVLGKQIRQILQVPDGGSIVDHARRLVAELQLHRTLNDKKLNQIPVASKPLMDYSEARDGV